MPEKKERNETIKRKYLQDGETMAELADEYDISRQRVQQILSSQGVEGHNNRDTVSEQDCIEAIQTVYEETGQVPNMAEWSEGDHSPSGQTILRLFPGWKDFLYEAGLPFPETSRTNGETEMKRKRYFQALDRIVEETGEVPTRNEFNEQSELTFQYGPGFFESYSEFIEQAGYDSSDFISRDRAKDYSDTDLLRELRSALEEKQGYITIKEWDTNHSPPSSVLIRRRFGTWSAAFNKALGRGTNQSPQPFPDDRIDRFVNLYNNLDDELRDRLDVGPKDSFASCVHKVANNDSDVSQYRDRLLAFGRLRNAIVHDNGFGEEPIAKPRRDVVEEMETIVEELLSPPRLDSFHSPELEVFEPSDSLRVTLRYMKDHDYSQVIVHKEGKLVLLTTEAIGHWLETNVDEDNLVLVEDASVGDALNHTLDDSFVCMARSDSVYDAREAFEQSIEVNRPRLYAIIVTEHGKRTESPLGIVTPWDLITGDR